MDSFRGQLRADENMTDACDTVIVGLGATGLSVARFLARQGVDFAITDSRLTPPGMPALLAEQPRARVSVGGFDPALLAKARRVVVSPGIARDDPRLLEYLPADAEVIGDIELFVRQATAPVIGVTGSNGKSTVTTLVGRMLAGAGRRVLVGGNLGPPALDLLDGEVPEFYILELSSFQLETTRSLRAAAAVVLNFSEDHLDRYPRLADYAAAKSRIYENAAAKIVNCDDPMVMRMPGSGGATLGFSVETGKEVDFHVLSDERGEHLAFRHRALIASSELGILGRHNVANALAALALGHAVGVPPESMLEALRGFRGLPHRCETVDTIHGVAWVNDSKATNVGAVRAAILGLGAQRPIVLIAGGRSKGASFEELAGASRGAVRHAVLLGEAAGLIAKTLAGHVPVTRVASMQEAVYAAAGVARPGDVVLLSPACASFDMFENYAARGRAFIDAVKQLKQ
jgi:UDP-N-acetylmuramoylalanine--D-glutamate ligase